jgi:hypothetical protein
VGHSQPVFTTLPDTERTMERVGTLKRKKTGKAEYEIEKMEGNEGRRGT